jgi:hypothetical protein
MEHPFLSLKSRFPYGERAHQRDREVEPFPARV